MPYFLNLFSPETYEAFSRSDRSVSGFRDTQKNAASRINPGDIFVCYMTKLGRWVGLLDVIGGPYHDDTPIFYENDDPFTVRFKVKPIIWLDKEHAIPIREGEVWDTLSFTKGHDRSLSTWTGKIRSSLGLLDENDGEFLERIIKNQVNGEKVYEIDEREYAKLVTHKVRTLDKTVTVSIPEDSESEEDATSDSTADVRESIKIQALLASIGARMGLRIWIPRNDRNAVFEEWQDDRSPVLDILPLNYDETTLKTIERIDVLWLKGRMIVRAFEVEHTTSIYSGILRMADLLALQSNMNIRLHIVAPFSRREKVFQELRRPVFSLLDSGPLSERCTYISYDSLRELAQQKHLEYFSHDVLDEYAEEAE